MLSRDSNGLEIQQILNQAKYADTEIQNEQNEPDNIVIIVHKCTECIPTVRLQILYLETHKFNVSTDYSATQVVPSNPIEMFKACVHGTRLT